MMTGCLSTGDVRNSIKEGGHHLNVDDPDDLPEVVARMVLRRRDHSGRGWIRDDDHDDDHHHRNNNHHNNNHKYNDTILSWPAWEIVSSRKRKRKTNRPSWYDVEVHHHHHHRLHQHHHRTTNVPLSKGTSATTASRRDDGLPLHIRQQHSHSTHDDDDDDDDDDVNDACHRTTSRRETKKRKVCYVVIDDDDDEDGDDIIQRNGDGSAVTKTYDTERHGGVRCERESTERRIPPFPRPPPPPPPPGHAVIMTAVPSQRYDYVLDFPPHEGGIGLLLSKDDDDKACFVECTRPIQSTGQVLAGPPQPGDTVETVDGVCTGGMGYDHVRRMVDTNAGKKFTWIGLKRTGTAAAAKAIAPTKGAVHAAASTRRIGDDEYELRIPVHTTTGSLGIRVRHHGTHTSLETLHRELDRGSEVTPQYGDFFVTIDGIDAIGLRFDRIKNLLYDHGDRRTRVLRLKRTVAIPQLPTSENGRASVPTALYRASQTSTTGEIIGRVPVLRPGWYGTGPNFGSSGAVAKLGNGVHVCSSLATSFFDFDIAVHPTACGLGLVVFQFGGRAHFERFHHFASVRYVHGIVPQGGEEVIAVDDSRVDDLSYQQLIARLKDHGDRRCRVMRLRRYERTLPVPTSL